MFQRAIGARFVRGMERRMHRSTIELPDLTPGRPARARLGGLERWLERPVFQAGRGTARGRAR